MSRHTTNPQLLICPNCGSDRVRRSVRKGAEDWISYHLIFKNPYHCGACDERFFSPRSPCQERTASTKYQLTTYPESDLLVRSAFSAILNVC
jgi:YgiT-type zinc finger domain-containing protein